MLAHYMGTRTRPNDWCGGGRDPALAAEEACVST